ncbi:hypothetical protein ACQKWADRAFT_312706 [Trichoderma austrokoningii]
MAELCDNTRKRRQPPDPSQPEDVTRCLLKRQKTDYPLRLPSAFWDSFGDQQIPLTRNALAEFDRRNDRTPSARHLPQAQVRRPVTRRLVAVIRGFARNGGPDLIDLRGYREPPKILEKETSARQSSGSTPISTATKNHRAAPPRPKNIEEIRQALADPRRSLSPSRFGDEQFENFGRADARASKEAQIAASVIPIIEGDVGDRRCGVAGQIPFTNLDPLTNGSLVPGNPDRYYGARPEQLDQQIRSELDRYIVPSTQKDLPMVPNFILAVKGPDGSAAVAKRQLSYDMSLAARGVQKLQSYLAEEMFDNNAYTIGYTFYDGALKAYTCHPIPPWSPGGPPGFAMTQINSWSLTGTAEAFRQGAGAYRNGMLWAKAQRDEAIKQANERFAARMPPAGHASQDIATEATRNSKALSPIYDFDTSANELSVGWPSVKLSKRLER